MLTALAVTAKPLISNLRKFDFSALGTDSNLVSGRFIVEFQDPKGLAKRSVDSDPVTAFNDILSRNGIIAKPVFKYDAEDLFVGASFDSVSSRFSSDPDTIEHLRSLPDVKAVWPVRRITLNSYNPSFQADSQPYAESSEPPHSLGTREFADPVENKEPQNNFSSSSTNYPRWSPHTLTGVDVLHNRGLTGKNVTIGIIDSGTFYLHPALGGGYGPKYKVTGGYNYLGGVYDPSLQEIDITDYEVLDCLGHGTHVAGIVAASNNSRLVGVAPDAKIRSYKVFGCTGSTTEDVIIKALIKAYVENCDIINVSIGDSGSGFTGNPVGNVIDTIAAKGVFVVAAAGNDGGHGAFSGNGVATSDMVVSVGATDTGILLGYEAKAVASNGDTFTFSYLAPPMVQPNMEPGEYQLTVGSGDTCSLNSSGPEITNEGAIILPKGKCSDSQSFYSTRGLGYQIIVSYDPENDTPQQFNPRYLEDFVVRIQAERRLGDWVSRQTSNKQSIKLVFTEESFIPKTLSNSNYVGPAYYSSQGPTYSGGFYPLVSAPGTGIYSTYKNYSYARFDGTSMAAPYISGLFALYIEGISSKGISPKVYTLTAMKKLIHTANAITTG